ncbi:hypothetical protein MVEN_01023600 [Mycena venus]|uniref:Ribosomal protein S8 n=1 Tax=Mycena venus TaxID=2733690 RepID=A0A8H7D304_9AGAR|nr:hypothetical protein MVEN_01023600 [Mycena venus]
MVRISVLNDCLNNIVNAERRGKRQVLIRPSSKVVVKFLSVMQRHGEHIISSYFVQRVFATPGVITTADFPDTKQPAPPLSTGCYINEFEIIDDHRSGKIVIQLNGRLNKTGVISPRFNVQHSQIESWVNLLPPRSWVRDHHPCEWTSLPPLRFTWLIALQTTSSGILDHEEARRKNVGGKLLGYVY